MPLLGLSLAFVAGIALAAVAGLPTWVWGLGAGLGIAAAVFEGKFFPHWQPASLQRSLRLPLGLLLAVVFLGGLRWQSARPDWGVGDLAYYNDRGKVELTGWVESYPDRRENAVLLRVRVETLQPEGGEILPVQGIAQLRLPAGADWQYGERVEIWGSPVSPPDDGDFSYRDYLARQGVHTYLAYPYVRSTGSGAGSPLMAAIYRLRGYAYRTINRIYPQPEAALMAGVLLGLERDMPEDLVSAFQDTGTAHIVAISGFNMTILAALLIGLLGRFLPRGWSALAAAAGITFYTLLVGANPAVVRAAIMSSLALFGRLIGRGSSGLTPLAFSAALMCLVNPMLPWDAGFQLSFSATLGLILYGDPLQRWFERWAASRWGEGMAHKLAGPVSEYLLFTMAAQVTTLPVVLMHFRRLSLTSLLANPLILPVQPGVMILGGLALIAGMILPFLGQILAWLAWPLAAYTLLVVEALGSIPSGAVSIGEFTPMMALACYALLFGLTLGKGRVAQIRRRLTPGLAFAALGLVVLVLWSAVLRRPDGRLHVTLLDTPDSQAAVLRLPGGQTVLVGGGAGANSLGSSLGRLMGPLRRNIDGLVVYEASAAQLSGLPALVERFPVGQAFWAVPLPNLRTAQRVNQAVADGQTEVAYLEAGSTLQLEPEIWLRVLAAGDKQAALQLTYGNLCLLWPGEFPPEALRRSGQRVEGCLLLLEAGEDPAAWADFLPLGVVYFGSEPQAGSGVLSIGTSGQINMVSDGEKLWIYVEK